MQGKVDHWQYRN